MTQTITAIEQELRLYADPARREQMPRFFKAGKGEYGEGDRFLGVAVPDVRQVARRHKNEPPEVAAGLLQSPWHECRLCALLMLVERFKRADEAGRGEVFRFYLTHTGGIDNWDLVDLSAPYIVGEYLKGRPRDVLYHLARSARLWDKRIAMVSTLALIRACDYADTLRLATLFLRPYEEAATTSPATPMHDLMQKATGWMLREVGKRDKDVLVGFLSRHAAIMPRTMLRYALEKFPPAERIAFLQQSRKQRTAQR